MHLPRGSDGPGHKSNQPSIVDLRWEDIQKHDSKMYKAIMKVLRRWKG